MSALTCDHCGAETSNGLALCSGCRDMLLYLLGFVPIYYRNLSRWRPSSVTGDRKRTKSENLVDTMVGILETGQTRAVRRPSSFSVATTSTRVADLLDETHADITGWARALSDDRPQLARAIARILAMEPEQTVPLLCALLTKYVATLTTLPWVRDIVHGVGEMERRLRHETEQTVPGWYAGACRRCQTDTFVVPGLTWVTCRGCGAITAARDHLDVILDEARDWTARPKQIAEALVALVDTEQSVPRLYERIKRWGQPDRQKITPVVIMRRAHVFDLETERIVVGEEQYGHARYRFGEVFDVLMAKGATRVPPRLSDNQAATC